jgi:hypothetical protein
MNEEQLKKLSKFYKTLKGLLRAVEDLISNKWGYVPESIFKQVDEDINQILREFTNIIPPYNPKIFYDGTSIEPEAVRAYLLRLMSSIEAELEDLKPSAITGPTLSFAFIWERNIKDIIERDYPELLTAFNSGCKKSSLVLAGSIIEAMLLDYVLRNQSAALSSSKAPKERDPLKWNLENLIDVCVELRPELQPVQSMSHTVRKYRNLVHPAVEIRNTMKVELEEAKVAISVLHIVHRELS